MSLANRKRTIQVFIGAAVFTVAASVAFIRGTGLFTFDDESPTEIASPLNDTLANVLAPTDVLPPDEVQAARKWEEPDFSLQNASLGWKEDSFDVPASMQKRVDFWITIYSKYSTDQGVLHDPVTLDVYEPVQFEPLKPGDSLSANGRARQKAIDEKKAIISDRLQRLQIRLDQFRSTALTTPFDNEPTATSAPSTLMGAIEEGAELTGTDLRYWALFEKNNDPNKFRRAAARIRFQLGQRDRFYLGIYFLAGTSPRWKKSFAKKVCRSNSRVSPLWRVPSTRGQSRRSVPAAFGNLCREQPALT